MLEHANREAASLRSAFEAAVHEDGSPFPFSELAVVSTCNRVEFYVACNPMDALRATALLRTALEGSGETTYLYVHRGRDAVRHLCRVAAGLDSLVLGEPQIAGQVARSFEQATHTNGSPSLLGNAAALARKAGRRARAETAIARGPVSISSVSIRLIAERLGGIQGRRILVLGAGRIGAATCEVLRNSGAQVTVANRTLRNAEVLARRVSARAAPLHRLPQLLADADAVIASTASPVALIDARLMEQALRMRPQPRNQLPLFVIDIAVPCNVAADVHGTAGVEVIGIDDLRTRVSAHLDERKAEVPRVEAIIDEELAAGRIEPAAAFIERI
jgi:glutamyl-tRNA reductase